MKKLHSAAEIAKLGLAGLPTTKVAIATRADREGWYFEVKKGLGGTRRVYEIPRHYLEPEAAGSRTSAGQPGKVVGTVVAGTSTVDTELLQLAEEALDEWLRAKALSVDSRRRGAIVALLYDYMAKGADQEAAANMLKVMGE